MKLYEIPTALRQIEELIEEADGVLTPELEAALDGLTEEFDSKAEYIAMLIRESKLEAEAWKAEEERVATRRRVLERRSTDLTHYLHSCMKAAGRDKIKGSKLAIAVQRNGVPSIRYDGDVMALPETFRRVKVEVDTLALRAAYKAGEELPAGVTAEVGTHIRIR
jgi:hypothetical protein